MLNMTKRNILRYFFSNNKGAISLKLTCLTLATKKQTNTLKKGLQVKSELIGQKNYVLVINRVIDRFTVAKIDNLLHWLIMNFF